MDVILTLNENSDNLHINMYIAPQNIEQNIVFIFIKILRFVIYVQ